MELFEVNITLPPFGARRRVGKLYTSEQAARSAIADLALDGQILGAVTIVPVEVEGSIDLTFPHYWSLPPQPTDEEFVHIKDDPLNDGVPPAQRTWQYLPVPETNAHWRKLSTGTRTHWNDLFRFAPDGRVYPGRAE